MIGKLKGTVDSFGPDSVTVDVHGVELVTGRDVSGDLQVPAGGVAVVRES